MIDSPVVRAGAHGERHRGGHLARVERRPTRRRNARNARDVQPARAEDVVERGGVVGGELVGDDERLGEIVGAAILRTPGSALDEAGLHEFLADRLAKFKIPERVWFLDDPLPRNANGKFLKRELRETLIDD